MPGQTITFNVSESLPRGVNIAQYEWDSDGDGVIDEVGPIPVATRSYAAVFEGAATVRITHATGGLSTASTGVHIGRGRRDASRAAGIGGRAGRGTHALAITSPLGIRNQPSSVEPQRCQPAEIRARSAALAKPYSSAWSAKAECSTRSPQTRACQRRCWPVA